jgi:adenosylhomocysteinase
LIYVRDIEKRMGSLPIEVYRATGWDKAVQARTDGMRAWDNIERYWQEFRAKFERVHTLYPSDSSPLTPFLKSLGSWCNRLEEAAEELDRNLIRAGESSRWKEQVTRWRETGEGALWLAAGRSKPKNLQELLEYYQVILEQMRDFSELHRELMTSVTTYIPYPGADLLTLLHRWDRDVRGGAEETTTGLLRLRRLESEGKLRCPVIAVNESRTERTFNDRYGTGQSALDGILRATNLLLAGRTLVLFGYGATGKGIAQRARGAGAHVIVCEVDPMRALEARMDGYEAMPALEAAERGDLFVTVTGSRDVIRPEHMERMKDGAVLANAGHFDVEIDLPGLHELAGGAVRQVLPLVEQYEVREGRRLNLLAQGRVVNLAAGEGHPAAVMDMSFANLALAVEHLTLNAGELEHRVLPMPQELDAEIARLKLESLGVEIDSLTPEQEAYLSSWGGE